MRATASCLAALLTVPLLLLPSASAAPVQDETTPSVLEPTSPDDGGADTTVDDPAPQEPGDDAPHEPADDAADRAAVPSSAVVDWRRPEMDAGVHVPLVSPDSGPAAGGTEVRVRSNRQLVTDVAAGPGGVSVVTRDGQLISWGKGTGGELGTGATADSTTPVSVGWAQMDAQGAGGYQNYLAVTRSMSEVADHATYAIVSEPYDGRRPADEGGIMLMAWGHGGSGRLGWPGAANGPNRPSSVLGFASASSTRVVDVAASTYGAVALLSDGEIRAWGRGVEGQLGNGTTTAESRVPVQVDTRSIPAHERVVRVEAGYQSYYALTDHGSVYAWGQNNLGQLGDGSLVNRTVPTRVGWGGTLLGQPVRDIAVLGRSVVALGFDGRVHAWGRGDAGQMGNGTFILVNANPVMVDTTGEMIGQRIERVFGSANAAFAVDADGVAYAWGGGGFGERGDGALGNTARASRVATPASTSRIVEIQGAGIGVTTGTVVALRSDGAVLTWGYNSHGQLGTGAATGIPVQRPARTLGDLGNALNTRVSFDGVEGTVLRLEQFGAVMVVRVPPGSPGWARLTLEGGSLGVSPFGGLEWWPRDTAYEAAFRYDMGPVAPTVVAHPDPASGSPGGVVELRAAATGFPGPEVRWETAPVHSDDWQPLGTQDVVVRDEATERPDGLVEVGSTITVEVGQTAARYRAVFTNEPGSAVTDPATVSPTWEDMGALRVLLTPRVTLVGSLPGRERAR
ncbi:hypothetical protein EBM89_11045 [Cellulomonas triticagri]|uniref:RCC1-like domain-containing protein n=1 Tax=Cellulomonas triticagri TaxID=2483352 RepID=A0A3M2JCM1_9CELL|nr:hypothetical protein EBM89_11045 [Cellulomonas triticagri]